MFCGECGTKNTGTSQFCENCGAKLAGAPEQQVNPSPVEGNVSNVQPNNVQPMQQNQMQQPLHPFQACPSSEIQFSLTLISASSPLPVMQK